MHQPASVAPVPRERLPRLATHFVLGLALGLAALAAVPDAAAKSKVTVTRSATALPGPSYAWAEMPATTAVESDARVADVQFRARLQAALDKALQAKGYRPVAPGGKPDIVVGYRVGVRDVTETEVHTAQPSGAVPQAGFQCGGGTCGQVMGSDHSGTAVTKLDTRSRSEGGLMVEVLEPGTVRVLWRATNRGTVRSEGGSQRRLEAIARDTLDQLPAAAR